MLRLKFFLTYRKLKSYYSWASELEHEVDGYPLILLLSLFSSLGSKYLQPKSCKYVSPCCKVLQNISYEDGTHLSTRSCQNLLSFSFIVSFSPWNGPSSIQHLELLACIKKEKVCVFNFNVKEIISKYKILNGTKPDAHYFNIPTVYKYTF